MAWTKDFSVSGTALAAGVGLHSMRASTFNGG